ncbi:MAG: GDP-mannose dehydrogenase [Polaromonas sp.]|nr:GDP-mannose dehydrogenase [Polaromonas sp.]
MLVHFVGIGKMGLPMAGHLHAGGYQLTVSDLSASQCVVAKRQGLAVASECSAAINKADVIFSSLPNDAALALLTQEILGVARPETIFVDTSTVSMQVSAQCAQLLERAGIDYLRTTVSGNNKMAEEGKLTIMASGPRVAFDKVQPLLACFGPNQFYLGVGEQARLMKLVVNLMIAQTSSMLAEGLALGRKGGLGWRDMWRVLEASAVGSPILKAKAVQLSERDFAPTFSVEQMVKDLGLILDAAGELHSSVPQTALTYQLMHAAIAQGDGHEDYASIVKVVERISGLDTCV